MSKIEEQNAAIQDKIQSLFTISGMYCTNPDATEGTGVTTSEKHLIIHRKRLQAAEKLKEKLKESAPYSKTLCRKSRLVLSANPQLKDMFREFAPYRIEVIQN